MVFVNSQKFACESCIKGHRSSSCAHTDRPLFEIKKKGRPVSQCERCRELRNTKRVHSKCSCADSKAGRSRDTEKAIGTKQKRYIPIVPALPNGLKDAFPPSILPSRSSDPRQKVDSLLNPCPCADVWNCQCRASSSAASPDPDPSSGVHEPLSNGLATLARAAAALCCSDEADTPQHPPSSPSLCAPATAPQPADSTTPKHYHRPPTPPHAPRSHKRTRKSITRTPSPGPALPPLVLPPAPPADFTPPFPTFGTPMPPFSMLTSLAGSGCTCGLRCSCPDCAEHRPHSSARECGDGCGDCVDEGTMSVDLSAVGCGYRSVLGARGEGAGGDRAETALDRFFAYAARVPPPGGRVALPKLCCGGDCGCGSRCGCGSACNGCCSEKAGGSAEQEVAEVHSVAEEREERAASCCC